MAKDYHLVVLAIPLALLLGCAQIPLIDIVPAVESQQVVFDISHTGINGIVGFRVEDESGKPLWVFHTNYEKGHRIVYGVLPTESAMTQQEFPPDNRPPASIRGKKVLVSVMYQYDTNLAACGTFSKAIQVPE